MIGFRKKSAPTVTAGLFGKVPGFGDFLAEGLSRAFTDVLDGWIREGFRIAGEHPDSNDRYMCSPVWRFAFAQQLAGRHSWVGVISPSVDSVGRSFPLVIAFRAPSVPLTDLERAERLCQRALEDDYDTLDAWRGEVLSLSTSEAESDVPALIAPERGGKLRAVSADGELLQSYSMAGPDPYVFARMIGWLPQAATQPGPETPPRDILAETVGGLHSAPHTPPREGSDPW